MTFFKERTVFFIDIFGWFRGGFGTRSDKQLGKITKAIRTLDIINEDIIIKNEKDRKKVDIIRDNIYDRMSVRQGNKALATSLKTALS